LDKLNLVK